MGVTTDRIDARGESTSEDLRSTRYRSVALMGALVTVSLGIALMVRAHLGVAPGDVLNTGGSERFGIGVGTMGWVNAGAMTVLAVALRRRPQLGTVLGAIAVGQFVNWYLQVIPEPQSMALRIPMLVAGLAILYPAIAVGVASNLGTGPIELVMLGLHDKGMGMQSARWLIEGLMLAAGILLGGDFGVITIVFVLVTGPVLARLIPPAARHMGTMHLTMGSSQG